MGKKYGHGVAFHFSFRSDRLDPEYPEIRAAFIRAAKRLKKDRAPKRHFEMCSINPPQGRVEEADLCPSCGNSLDWREEERVGDV